MAMKRWLAIVVVLGAVFLLGSSPVSAAKMEVKGVIADWKEGKARIPASAYLQLVKDLPEGKYLIALQRAMPREMSGNSMATAIPILITGEGEPLIIEVPGTFPLDVGRVDVGVRVPKAPSASGKK
jgi:hypothetical protein